MLKFYSYSLILLHFLISAKKQQSDNQEKEEVDDEIEREKVVRIVHRVVACQDFKALRVRMKPLRT